MTARRLFLAAALALALPGAAQAACVKSKGTPLRTDDELTLDYLICKHREQVEALQRQRVRVVPPQDKTQIPEGAVNDLDRRTSPFNERARRTQEALDSMGDVNTQMGDRLKMLEPRRLP
ncbi:hypothetical protein [Cereibacter sediminicola]|uniref:hypothetical protein n=1 Tax=Cereibacter sediminicola TaxID=2584941 RepID=UPI0011A5471E|nr:hypothetical protein [Cereibacter sediminicola]